MIEVFSTNIRDRAEADRLLEQIHQAFQGHTANFDLDDCDRILRIQYSEGKLDTEGLIRFLQSLGCVATVLPDEAPAPAGLR